MVLCEVFCSQGGCDRKFIRIDCKKNAPPEVPQLCRASRGGETAACVDASLTPCTAGTRASCTDAGHQLFCQAMSEGAFTRTESCHDPARTCHLTLSTTACVDAPKQSCDPGAHPQCKDAKTLVECVGTQAAGFVTQSRSCAVSCQGGGASPAYCK